MLVVISDLHFEEEDSTVIPGQDEWPPLTFSRNLPPRAFVRFVNNLAEEARRNGARRLDLVLAGDIFEITRSSLWLDGPDDALRPYVDNGALGAAGEARVRDILTAINRPEGKASASLAVFRRLLQGEYEDPASGEVRAFPVPASLYFIPGNHDRLVNATPALRRQARALLGLPASPEPFPHVLAFSPEGAMIRHGHEYDPHNFGLDIEDWTTLPLHLPEAGYARAPLGDYVTQQLNARLPRLFRAHYGDERIIRHPLLRRVYLRLLEYDDLRPQSALFHYLLDIPELATEPTAIWEKAVEPVAYALLEEIHDDDFLLTWLDRLDQKWSLDTIDLIQGVLQARPWRAVGIPLQLLHTASGQILRHNRGRTGAAGYAARESGIRDGTFRFVVAGHTHRPRVELTAHDAQGERYYVDTGTWRNRVLATPNYAAFARMKGLTFAVLYGPDEDPGAPYQPGKIASLDFWAGLTQRWLADEL